MRVKPLVVGIGALGAMILLFFAFTGGMNFEMAAMALGFAPVIVILCLGPTREIRKDGSGASLRRLLVSKGKLILDAMQANFVIIRIIVLQAISRIRNGRYTVDPIVLCYTVESDNQVLLSLLGNRITAVAGTWSIAFLSGNGKTVVVVHCLNDDQREGLISVTAETAGIWRLETVTSITEWEMS